MYTSIQCLFYYIRFKIKANIEKSIEFYWKYNEGNISQYGVKISQYIAIHFCCIVTTLPADGSFLIVTYSNADNPIMNSGQWHYSYCMKYHYMLTIFNNMSLQHCPCRLATTTSENLFTRINDNVKITMILTKDSSALAICRQIWSLYFLRFTF